MNFINSHLFYGIILLLLGLFQFLNRKKMIQKWYNAYSLNRQNSDNQLKKNVILMQYGAIIISIVVGIIFVIKGLELD